MVPLESNVHPSDLVLTRVTHRDYLYSEQEQLEFKEGTRHLDLTKMPCKAVYNHIDDKSIKSNVKLWNITIYIHTRYTDQHTIKGKKNNSGSLETISNSQSSSRPKRT